MSPRAPGLVRVVVPSSSRAAAAGRRLCRSDCKSRTGVRPAQFSHDLQSQLARNAHGAAPWIGGDAVAYCQLFIQAIMIRLLFGTLLNVTPA